MISDDHTSLAIVTKQAANAHMALIAVLTATGPDKAGRALCAALMDGAAEVLTLAGSAELRAVSGMGAVDRLATLAHMASVCAACAACPRGRQSMTGPDISEPSRDEGLPGHRPEDR